MSDPLLAGIVSCLVSSMRQSRVIVQDLLQESGLDRKAHVWVLIPGHPVLCLTLVDTLSRKMVRPDSCGRGVGVGEWEQ